MNWGTIAFVVGTIFLVIGSAIAVFTWFAFVAGATHDPLEHLDE